MVGLGLRFLRHGGIRVCVFEACGGLGYGFLKHGWIEVWVFEARGD